MCEGVVTTGTDRGGAARIGLSAVVSAAVGVAVGAAPGKGTGAVAGTRDGHGYIDAPREERG